MIQYLQGTDLNEEGLEHLKELDEKTTDGTVKEIVAMLAWEEKLFQWEEAEDLLEVYSLIEAVLK